MFIFFAKCDSCGKRRVFGWRGLYRLWLCRKCRKTKLKPYEEQYGKYNMG